MIELFSLLITYITLINTKTKGKEIPIYTKKNTLTLLSAFTHNNIIVYMRF